MANREKELAKMAALLHDIGLRRDFQHLVRDEGFQGSEAGTVYLYVYE